MHGFGIYSWPDGRKYEGNYVDDKKMALEYIHGQMGENMKEIG